MDGEILICMYANWLARSLHVPVVVDYHWWWWWWWVFKLFPLGKENCGKCNRIYFFVLFIHRIDSQAIVAGPERSRQTNDWDSVCQFIRLQETEIHTLSRHPFDYLAVTFVWSPADHYNWIRMEGNDGRFLLRPMQQSSVTDSFHDSKLNCLKNLHRFENGVRVALCSFFFLPLTSHHNNKPREKRNAFIIICIL